MFAMKKEVKRKTHETQQHTTQKTTIYYSAKILNHTPPPMKSLMIPSVKTSF